MTAQLHKQKEELSRNVILGQFVNFHHILTWKVIAMKTSLAVKAGWILFSGSVMIKHVFRFIRAASVVPRRDIILVNNETKQQTSQSSETNERYDETKNVFRSFFLAFRCFILSFVLLRTLETSCLIINKAKCNIVGYFVLHENTKKLCFLLIFI